VGPIARSAEDCSLLLESIAPAYRPSTQGRASGALALRGGRHGNIPRVGVVTDLIQKAHSAVAAAVEEAARELGAEPVEAPVLEHASVIQQLNMLPEATTAHLPWMRTKLADYGADVRARLLAGLVLPATAYPTGLRARRWLAEQVRPLFERYDILAAPTMPIVAPPLDAIPSDYRLLLMPFNSPWSCLGLPTASVPCGFVDGLPVGMALVGGRGEDAAVLDAARRFQEVTDWHERRPRPVAGHAA
jgi:aspartyl-tRNA(Asn)/glutamyl-tRNA(Gln) amidotransferase subunit A